jgi:leucyl-tRNA synthetase
LNRVYRLVQNNLAKLADEASDGIRQKTHATIKRVSDDMDRFHFNTAIAAIMELVNALYQAPAVDRPAAEAVVRLLAPMAPHLSEELWHMLGHRELLATHPWPSYDAQVAAKKRVAFPVQVNGKLRGQVEAEPDAAQAAIEEAARALPTVRSYVDGKQLVKVVFVPGRLINFVVRP